MNKAWQYFVRPYFSFERSSPFKSMTSIKGYIDYKRREFCKDVKCSVQLELDTREQGSEEHEKIREICKKDCKYTTYQFHHWLLEKGYLVVRPETTKEH